MFSFSRRHRLAGKHTFQTMFGKSRKLTHKHLIVLYRPNQMPYARLGIIIGKHTVKRAVDRNRIRRIVRESFRHHKESVKGLDILLIMRSKCTALDKKAWRDDRDDDDRDNIDNLWQTLKTKQASSSKPV